MKDFQANVDQGLAKKLANYATMKDVLELDERLGGYARLSEQIAMESRVKPILEKCEKDLVKFKLDNENMRQAIVAFDSVMASKADRVNILEIRQWCEKEFPSNGTNKQISQKV